MKTCDLKEINYLPSGIFVYTPIKTCVFYFVKKREGTDVLEMKINVSKTQKETGRDYKFSKTHQTTKVKFYDYNPYEDVKNLLVEVPIEKIASNSYSLNYAEYMTDETEEEQYEDGVVVKTLGEVCEFLSGKKKNASEAVENGKYKFITCSIQGYSYLNEYDFEDKALIINSINGSGRCMIYCADKYSTTNNNFHFKVKNKEQNLTEYIYYYLYQNIKLLEDGFIGANQKKISKEYISNIKIPIPSLERQHGIVSYLDFIYERANKTSNQKIAELKQLNGFCLSNQKIFGENVVKTLGEVCEKIHSGKFNSKDSNSVGKYPFYTNKANNPEGYADKYCFDYEKYFILIKDGGAGDKKYGEHIGLGKVFKVYGKSAGTSHQYALIPKKDFDYDYLYQYLKFIKNNIMDLAHYTTGLGCIKKGDIDGLKISIPSLERQKEIVEYCEFNDTLIKQLEKEIENNKQLAHQFINGIVNVHSSSSEPSSELYGSELSFGEEEEEEKEDAISLVVEEVETPKTQTELQAELAFLLSSPSFDM